MYIEFSLKDETVNHTRQVYGILDLFGDLGGVVEVILMLGALSLSSFTEHSFVIKALQKFYQAATTNDDLFQETQSGKRKQKLKKNGKIIKSFSKS